MLSKPYLLYALKTPILVWTTALAAGLIFSNGAVAAEQSRLVGDINTTAGPTARNPENFCVLVDQLFFTGYDLVHGIELWRTDGTSAGTAIVRDTAGGVSTPRPLHLQPGPDGFLTFFYTRSVMVSNSGTILKAEWSQELSGLWSIEGVTETVDSVSGGQQIMRALVPAGTSGMRFVRLRATVP